MEEARPRSSKDIKYAEEVLNADHYGLEKVKERILEYLAVQQRVDKMKGPILCLVGPPGVGKTSLGKSIAKATGRNFVRMSLGGVRDEAEIRGHRRTYIGSMPGKIIQSMKKAKSSNPLFLLDEIDKLGADFRGDPSSALLEVLDPEQNSTFNDHYLEVDYDLSDVMFVTTANTLRMPQPLLDRMEIIRLAGYTEDEKVEIAKRHLIPKQIEAHGLKEGELDIARRRAARPDPLLHARGRRAQPRARDRQPGAQGDQGNPHEGDDQGRRSRAKNLDKYAGVRKFRYGEAEVEDQVGVVTGLAWTEVGGELLTIEAVMVPGKGTHDRHRQARRRDAGVGAGGRTPTSAPRADRSASSRRCSRSATSTSTCPRARRPRTARRPASAMVTSIVSVLTGIPVRKRRRHDRRDHACAAACCRSAA